MTRYCLLFCVIFLAIGVSCDQWNEKFGAGGGDESVTPDADADRNLGQEDLLVTESSNSGEEVRGDDWEVTAHVAFKPFAGKPAFVGEAERKSIEAPPSVETQALELATKELAINLRFMDEEDAAKRAELEQEMVKLRQQRQSLYQLHMEGK